MKSNLSINKIINNNLDHISKIYRTVNENINHYTDHTIHNNDKLLNEETISIVMTTHKRITQTLFTLDTINSSSYKNIQVIIVDDSGDQFIDGNMFDKYPFRIDYIKIKTENRVWSNPCVNYNIGFKYIKGNYIIIQNAEVCHIGDVINHVKQNCKEGTYLVFDVANTQSYANNNKLYELFLNNEFDCDYINQLIEKEKFNWYQHSIHRCRNYHFLTAIHAKDFKKLESGFDYDFSIGRWYDDDELLRRIQCVLKLRITNINSMENKLLGIHQHHETVMLGVGKKEYKNSISLNLYIYDKKKQYFQKHNKWIHLYNSQNPLNDFNSLFLNMIPYEISVVIPCYYPHIKYLDVILNDICAQTLLPKEVILAISEVDDDTKYGLFTKYSKQFDDKQITFKIINTMAKQNPGINRNMGAKIAKYEYITFINAGDTIHPQKIEITKYFLEKYQPNILLHSLVKNKPMNFLKSSHIDYEKVNIITSNQIFYDTFGRPPRRNRKRELISIGGHSIGIKRKKFYRNVTHGYATVKNTLANHFVYTDLRSGEDGIFVRDILWNVGNVIYIPISLLNYKPIVA